MSMMWGPMSGRLPGSHSKEVPWVPLRAGGNPLTPIPLPAPSLGLCVVSQLLMVQDGLDLILTQHPSLHLSSVPWP